MINISIEVILPTINLKAEVKNMKLTDVDIVIKEMKAMKKDILLVIGNGPIIDTEKVKGVPALEDMKHTDPVIAVKETEAQVRKETI